MDTTKAHGKPPRACQICGSEHSNQLRRAALVRPAVANIIEKETGHWDPDGWICQDDLQKYRDLYVQSLLKDERTEITDLEREVIESLRENETLSRNPDEEFEADLTVGPTAR